MTIKRFLSFVVVLLAGIVAVYADGKTVYKGKPWVRNISKPYQYVNGLDNVHLSLWASHGAYYDKAKGRWKFQRPKMFCTTEDLFTQTIVIPYLMPMLENAGAIVFSPRERGWQSSEIIIDNDTHSSSFYKEKGSWKKTEKRGFAQLKKTYTDGENPFQAGTARMTKSSEKGARNISYIPKFPKEDEYPVYVSYQTLSNSVPDAEYIVVHQGVKTVINVNQTMGGGTWVYLGTFRFDKGKNEFNMVMLTNKSSEKGMVTADAVRFGGGMGNILRNNKLSGLPRCLEGARYYTQWAGAPYKIYGGKGGENDYADDINSRSLFTNYLAGGSLFNKDYEGLGVPIELVMAVHSDAGYASDCSSIIGSLSICTTNTDGGEYPTGMSRSASYQFAKNVLSGLNRDIKHHFGRWHTRGAKDRNYSETRLPKFPAIILETLSHQNFTDIKWGADPNFRFVMGRSIYKTITRFVSDNHGRKCVIQPLTPDNFRIEMKGSKKIELSWDPVRDPLEKSAAPTSYILYTAIGSGGFDNGRIIKGTSVKLKPESGVLYSYKVAAVNKGGESFPTEVLSAMLNGKNKDRVLIVNGFHRLSSPAYINNQDKKGFLLSEDMGMWPGKNPGFCGEQIDFSTKGEGREGKGGLGYSGDELVGKFLMGNEFNYVREHADNISRAGKYNILSCSSHAVENGDVDLSNYDCVDLILGEEEDDGRSLVPYKTFSKSMRKAVGMYVVGGGRLLVSGAHVTSDMNNSDERTFSRAFLNTECAGKIRTSGSRINAFGRSFTIYDKVNEEHYASPVTDILKTGKDTKSLMTYSGGYCAAVAHEGDKSRTVVMGFPFECIREHSARRFVMHELMDYLMK